MSREVQPVIAVEHGPVWELFTDPALELFGLERINPPKAFAVFVQTDIMELKRGCTSESTEYLANRVLVNQDQLGGGRARHAHGRGAHTYNSPAADEVH